MAKKYGFIGSAWNNIFRQYQELLNLNDPLYNEYRFWATEFQVDNPNCPPDIAKALRARFRDRFGKATTQ